MLTVSATATVSASRSASGVAARAVQQGFNKFGFGWSNAEAHSFAHNIGNIGNIEKIEWSSGTPRTGACV